MLDLFQKTQHLRYLQKCLRLEFQHQGLGQKRLLECVDNHLAHRPFYPTFNRETQSLVVLA